MKKPVETTRRLLRAVIAGTTLELPCLEELTDHIFQGLDEASNTTNKMAALNSEHKLLIEKHRDVVSKFENALELNRIKINEAQKGCLHPMQDDMFLGNRCCGTVCVLCGKELDLVKS